MVWDAIIGEDLMYCVRMYNSRSCIDCYWIWDSELLYDCTYLFSSYNTRHSFHCKQVSDSAFLFDCHNTQNSFMCWGLRNKQYHIYNKAHSKEGYEKLMQKINLQDLQEVDKFKKYFVKEIVSKYKAATIEQCEDSSGKWLKQCKNVSEGYESLKIQDGNNIFQCADAKDIAGSFMCNDKVERCFQCCATGIGSMNVNNCIFVWHSSNMDYCYLCLNCQDCFGCIGLRNKKFHIFNKPYSEQEYKEKVDQLISIMKNSGEYPFFFPMDMSPFRYEDTIAYDLFEKENKTNSQISHHIGQELAFYEKHKIAKPILAFSERHRKRMQLMGNPFEQRNI